MPLDDPTENFYWVDENDNVLGQITRFEAHHDRNKIHRSVQIVLTNKKGEVLSQQRSFKKDKDPGNWSISTSGHVTYPDNYLETAYRELKEELGIETPLTFVTKIHYNGKTEQEMSAIFTGHYEQLPEGFDKDEVQAMKWITKTEIKAAAKRNEWSGGDMLTFKTLGYL